MKKEGTNRFGCRIARWALNKLLSLGYSWHSWLSKRSLPNKALVLSWDEQQIMVRNPRRSVIGCEIVKKGVWEPEVTEYICPKIVPGMTVLDVGADIGYYTLLFAKRVGPLGRVVAFEPIPEALEKLECNVRLNGYTNVTICDFALFSGSGSVILEAPLELSRINLAKSANEKNDIRIQTRTFDECESELNIRRVDLVKIDVEGAELDVLYGMQRSLKKYHPALLVEVHPEGLVCFKHRPEDVLRFLERMKYTIQPIDKPTLDFKGGNVTIYCTQNGGVPFLL